MQTVFNGDDTGKDDPAQRMGQEKHQQSFETGSAAEIAQWNDFFAQKHGNHSSYFPISKIVIFSGNVLLFCMIHINPYAPMIAADP